MDRIPEGSKSAANLEPWPRDFTGEQMDIFRRIRAVENLRRQYPEMPAERFNRLWNNLSKDIDAFRSRVFVKGWAMPSLLGKLIPKALRDDHKRSPVDSYNRSEFTAKVYREKSLEINYLTDHLARNGFYDDPFNHKELGVIYGGEKSLQIERLRGYGGDTMKYALNFKLSDFGVYQPVSLEAVLRKQIAVPPSQVIAGVDITRLSGQMDKIDWTKDFLNKQQHPATAAIEEEVFNSLAQLKFSGTTEGLQMHDLLAYKYMANTPNEQMAGNLQALKDRYEVKVKIDTVLIDWPRHTSERLYNLLDKRYTQGGWSVDRDEQWHGVDFSKKDRNGFHSLYTADSGQNYLLEAALLKSSVKGFPENFRIDPIESLKLGRAVEAVLDTGGGDVKRMITADPVAGGISIDWVLSANRDLLSPIPEHVRQYQQGKSAGDQDRAVELTAGEPADRSVIQSTENAVTPERGENSEKKENPQQTEERPGIPIHKRNGH